MAELNTQTDKGFDVAWADKAIERAKQAGEPRWAIEKRKKAAATAKSLSFPARNDELWRRTDMRSLETALEQLDPFATSAPAKGVEDLPDPVRRKIGDEPCALLVQRDGQVVLEQPNAELTKQGVIACSMERAIAEHGDKLEAQLGAMIDPNYDWYTAISAAIQSGGAFVYVPDNVEAAVPVRLFEWIDGAGKIAAPHSVVVIGRNAKATVLDEQLSETTDGVSFHSGAIEVVVGDGAKLIFGTLQDWGRNVFHYANHRAQIGRDAELQWIQTVLGARMVKSNGYFSLAGPGAQAFVHGFMFGDKRQHFHLHTLQRHLVENTSSDLMIKGCLKDRARSIYQGLIQVSEGAQKTDAYQANRNLLLSDLARADSIPGLEILANDVRCTHGATIGHVDDEQMYYLMARGLPENEAKRLIVEGFFAPVIDRIPLEGVREQLRQVIQHKIG